MHRCNCTGATVQVQGSLSFWRSYGGGSRQSRWKRKSRKESQSDGFALPEQTHHKRQNGVTASVSGAYHRKSPIMAQLFIDKFRPLKIDIHRNRRWGDLKVEEFLVIFEGFGSGLCSCSFVLGFYFTMQYHTTWPNYGPLSSSKMAKCGMKNWAIIQSVGP